MLPIPGAMIQIQQRIACMLAAPNAANVVTAKLHWRTVTRPPGYDPNDETTLGDASSAEDHSQEFRAFFHRVEELTTGFQRFAEIKSGDVILDYLADLGLNAADKEDQRIEVAGVMYVQKSIGRDLKESWGVHLGLGGTLKTLLLTPAS